MSFSGPERLNSVIDAAIRNCSSLIQAAKSSHGDPDLISRGSIRSAMEALENFSSVWTKEAPKTDEWKLRGNKVLDVVQQLKDDPSLQTALGTMQAEFSRILELVQIATRPDESKRVKGPNFDPMKKR